jgi:histidinol-phosphatase
LLDRALVAACEAARAAGAIERALFRSTGLSVEIKADATPVTAADRGAEAAIREVFGRLMPECGVVGEELGSCGPDRVRWIVDPLDATANFVAGIPYFAVLLGLEVAGELTFGLVHAPVLGPEGTSWWGAPGRGAWTAPGIPDRWDAGDPLRVATTTSLAAARICHGGLDVLRRSPIARSFEDLVDQVARTRGFGDWWGHCLVAEGRVDAMVEGAVAYHDIAAIVPLIEAAGGRTLLAPGAALGPGFNAPFVSVAPGIAEAVAEIVFR